VVDSGIRYSLVIPVYNEEDSLGALLKEILETMNALQERYEIIFINDGSTDSSLALLQGFKQEFPGLVEIIDQPERRGQTFAMRRGLEATRGGIIITLDADLQNDPADIPKLLAKMAVGYDVVCGWRQQRYDRALKTSLSKLGNISQRMLTGLNIHDVSCTLRAYQRECIGKIPLNWEGQHRFIPLSLSLQGYHVGEIVVNHRPRQYGTSKYGHRRVFKVVRDFFRILLNGHRE
jgi:glycosyltransferase involved in cell wall biosynthesis